MVMNTPGHHPLARPSVGSLIGPLLLLFTLVMIGGMSYWHTQISLTGHEAAQQALVGQSTQGAARLITQLIEERRRRVRLFAEENLHLPEDEEETKSLITKIKRHFPDYVAFTIADPQGAVLLDDFEGSVGELCREDIRAFSMDKNFDQVIIHPLAQGYHYDIMARWHREGRDAGIFFVSFKPVSVAKILASSQLHDHKMLLLHREQQDLIEVSAAGARDRIQRDIQLSQAERKRLLGEVAVEGTRWTLVDLPDADYLGKRRVALTQRAIALFCVFLLLVLIAFMAIRRAERKRTAAERALLDSHRLLEDRVEERTGALAEANEHLQQEVSERGQVQQELARSEQRFRQLVEGFPSSVLVIDEEGCIRQANARSEKVFGYALSELLGMRVEQLMPSALRAGHEQLRHEYRKSPRMRQMGAAMDLSARRKDGSEFSIDVGLSPLESEEGFRVCATVSDITDRREAERELHRMRRFLQNIIDSMPSVLVGVDVHGRVTLWNDSAQKMTGTQEYEALGSNLSDLFPWLDPQLEQVHDAIQTQKEVHTERLHWVEQGTPRYAEVMVYPLTAGSALGAVIRVDDISERVRMEQMMVQSEKMLSVGGLAAGMAHEINNPLSGILQSCQNMERRLSPELPGNIKTAEALGIELATINAYLEQRGILGFIQGIRDAAVRSAKIVSDMLAFSRRSTAEFAPARVDEMLETVVRLAATDYDLKKDYDFKQIQIERDYDPDLGPVRCDRNQIEQVLLNLLSNAAHAMAGQEAPHRLILRTRKVDGNAEIMVQDNGCGMDEETRRRIFEPFYTTKPVGVGTGLGLSVTYFILTKQHRGSVSLRSTPGQGTCFQIHLPLRGENDPA